MKKYPASTLRSLCIVGVGLCATTHLHAAIIAEDHFLVNYPTTPAAGEYSGNGLGGQNPTLTGWSVAWDKASSNDIIGNPMGLVYPGFASSGGCGSAPDGTRSGHPLTTAYTDATNATVYLSVLMKMDEDASGPYRTMELHSGGYDDGAHRKLQLGQSQGDLGTAGYGLRLFNNNSFQLDLGAMDTSVNLFVIKFVFSDVADADSITVWRNPEATTFGGTEPAGGQTLSGFNLQIDRTSIAHFGGARDIHLDEIRVGDTWADVTPVGSAPPAALRYTFDDGTLGDWAELTPSNTNSGPRNWAIAPGAFPGGNMDRHGSYAVGQNIQGGSQDSGHPTLVLRSPKFKLNGNGDLSAWLFGGHGYGADCTGKLVSNLPANAFDDPGNSTFPSFLGVALRNVDTGTYVLARKKNDPGNHYEKATFTDTELDALIAANPDHVYTLDLLDVRAGGWGWVAMDSVVIPGTIVPDTNTLPTISDVADTGIAWNGGVVGPISVTIGDAETPANDLTLTAASSNGVIVPTANLALAGTGETRSLTITPLADVFGATTITLTVSDGTDTKSDTFVFTVGRPPVALTYDFDDATLQGWSVLSSDPGQFFAITPPSPPEPGAVPNGAPHEGTNFVGLHLPVFGGDPFYYWDSAHTALWLRSPKFKLDASGLPMFIHLAGGGAGSAPPSNNPADIPAASTDPGFRGIALRNADTNQFVLTGTKASNGGDWQTVVFSPAQLAALDQDATYTLDLIDCAHGGWGWVNMDTVGIPGTVVSEPTDAFASWATTKGLTEAAAAFDADPDNDGVSNGLEFVLGGEPNPANPNAGSTPALPTAQAQGDNLVFTYNRADAAAYLNPTVEFDADLMPPWTTAVDPGNATIEVTDGTPADTVKVTIPKNGAPALFARLRVAQPAP